MSKILDFKNNSNFTMAHIVNLVGLDLCHPTRGKIYVDPKEFDGICWENSNVMTAYQKDLVTDLFKVVQ